MRTATVRDLRNNFKKISAWINNGEEVQITKNGKPYIIVSPLPLQPFSPPDLMARLSAFYGNKIRDAAETAKMLKDSKDPDS